MIVSILFFCIIQSAEVLPAGEASSARFHEKLWYESETRRWRASDSYMYLSWSDLFSSMHSRTSDRYHTIQRIVPTSISYVIFYMCTHCNIPINECTFWQEVCNLFWLVYNYYLASKKIYSMNNNRKPIIFGKTIAFCYMTCRNVLSSDKIINNSYE